MNRAIFVSSLPSQTPDQYNNFPETVHFFDPDTLGLTGAFAIQNASGVPTSLIAWGTNQMAFRTAGNQLYIIQIPAALLAPTNKTYLPHLALDGGYTTSIIVTNPSSTLTASGSINLLGNAGNPTTISIGSSLFQSVVPFALPPFGSEVFVDDTAAYYPNTPLSSGSARVISNNPVSSAVQFGSSTVGTTGVGQTAGATDLLLPALTDPAQGLSTGVAIHNLEAQDITVALTLYNLDGTAILNGTTSVHLPPNGHTSAFIAELFPSVQISGPATLLIHAGGAQIAAVAIELGAAPGQFSTLPVIPLDNSGNGSALVFPQFADGAGNTSSIVLLNASPTLAHASLNFFADDGSTIGSTQNLLIAPNGAAVYTTSGQGPLLSGSAQIHSDQAIGGVLLFNSPGLGIAGVGSAQSANGFMAYASRSLTAGTSTGVAVVGTGNSTNLTLTLRDQGGNAVPSGVTTIPLAANGHIARFIQELFPDVDTKEFSGSITVTSDNGPIAGMAILLGEKAGQFTTFPAAPIP